MAKRSKIEMVQASLVVPRGHDAFWQMVLAADQAGPWEVKSIDGQSNVDIGTIRDFVRRLVRAGIAEKVGTRPLGGGRNSADIFRLVSRPFETPRLDRDGKVLAETHYETLWRAMKMLKEFDAVELARETTQPDREIKATHAVGYLRALAAVHIVEPSDAAQAGQTKRFRLVLNLGAKAPSVSKTLVVFDPNSRTIVGLPVLEVAP